MNETYKEGEHTGSPLPKMVQWFKTMSTHDNFLTSDFNKYPNLTIYDNKLSDISCWAGVKRQKVSKWCKCATKMKMKENIKIKAQVFEAFEV